LAVACIQLCLRFFGIFFLPAPIPIIPIPTWTYWVFGGVISMPLTWLSLLLYREMNTSGRVKNAFISGFMIVMPPLTFGGSSNIFFGSSIPMLHTSIFGTEGAIEYRMRDAYDSHFYLSCRGVGVETGVYGHSILCGMELKKGNGLPLNRRALPRKGALITVSGRASRAGVFYTSFEARPGPPPE